MPKQPKTGSRIEAKWKNQILSWYWSGKYWYCVAVHVKGPTGVGKTRDEAFLDYKAQLNH